MALEAVQMVLQTLTTILVEESQFLGGVKQGVEQLRIDLESMESFLQDADSRSENEEGVKTWVKQVRNVAYDTEDVIEEFLLCLSPRKGHGFFHSLQKGVQYIRRLTTRHRLGDQVRLIREEIKLITERRQAFSFKVSNNASSSLAIETWHDPRLASLFLDEADVVGIEHRRSTLIRWLVTGELDLTTISVVGMGGLGKTTLVKKTFDSPDVKNCFDRRAWITVSKSFSLVELLQAALKGFLGEAKEQVPKEIDRMGATELINKLNEYLQEKRYVIVFDDVWSLNAWDGLKFAFPDCKSGSRIIITTRISNVAATIETISRVYHLQPLSEEEAWTLFCTKAFRGKNKGICPQELEEISFHILKKCGGLPLAIVAIAGLLSRKKELTLEWRKVHDNLGFELKNNSSLESLEKILLFSYKDLSYHLKCCFLYLCVFPEDYLIKRMKVIRLWVVERFVEEKPGLNMEQVAEEYLNEFVSRSMIQVVRMDHFNRVRTFRVHDLLREIILVKSRDESLAIILNDRSLALTEKIRRIAIHDNGEDFPSAITSCRRIRSVLLFPKPESLMSLKLDFLYSFRLLRVLELEGALLFKFPEELVKMLYLRYLSLRGTPIKKLPESIRKLRNLEILDLKYSSVESLPNGILHLEHLSQIRNYRFHFHSSSIYPTTYGMSVPRGIGRLTNLQKLGSVEVTGNGDIVKELGKLTGLRRLGILNLRREDGFNLCSSLEKMKHLTAIYMTSKGKNLQLDSLASPPPFIQRLFLKCNISGLPKWVESLQYLSKLVLQYCELHNDPLQTLQGLPNLVVLELREAYAGEELCCDSQGYPKLKVLHLYKLDPLVSIELKKGAMSGLKLLEIVSCDKLEMVPQGIEHLRCLQDLGLWGMPNRFIRRIEQSKGEDFWRIQHIPTIRGFLH